MFTINNLPNKSTSVYIPIFSFLLLSKQLMMKEYYVLLLFQELVLKDKKVNIIRIRIIQNKMKNFLCSAIKNIKEKTKSCSKVPSINGEFVRSNNCKLVLC